MYDRPANAIHPDMLTKVVCNAGSAPRSCTPIRDLISMLEDQATSLHAAYDALEERLGTALQPVSPPPTANAPSTAGQRLEERVHESDIASRLRLLNAHYYALAQRLESLHGRIEI